MLAAVKRHGWMLGPAASLSIVGVFAWDMFGPNPDRDLREAYWACRKHAEVRYDLDSHRDEKYPA